MSRIRFLQMSNNASGSRVAPGTDSCLVTTSHIPGYRPELVTGNAYVTMEREPCPRNLWGYTGASALLTFI